MFVKKLVEKASKKPGLNLDGLKAYDVNPRLVFHYGIPAGSVLLAYDSIQRILAISTKDGRVKLLGKDNTQALLESNETVPSKFLQFIENQGILLNVTAKNHIEVWDIDRKLLSHVHVFKEEITSFKVMQHGLYMYLGDSVGNISVLKLDQKPCQIMQMKYTIPFLASHGNPTESGGDAAIMHILPQPTAESKRVLIIFRDGLITLWDLRESKSTFTTGGNMLQSLSHETRKVTSACWACPFGSRVVVGYSNGEIFIWSVPSGPKSTELAADKELYASQSAPICRLNLGYKSDKAPIASLKWTYADGKASRLYVMGASDFTSANLLQVVLLNEQTESRTIKLGLHLPEPCFDMEIISSINESKHKQDYLFLLGRSSHIYVYDDYLIEKYLLQCQSRSPPSLPKEVVVKLPFIDSSITISKYFTGNPYTLSSTDEDYTTLAKNVPPLLPFEAKPKDGTHFNSTHFTGFAKIKNLYITGHSNGAINFWDASCPFLLPLVSLKHQNDDDSSLSGIAVTALYYDSKSRLFVSGDQSGLVRIFKFKSEPFSTENSFISLQGSTRKGSNHIIHSIKTMKVNGAVLSINLSCASGHLGIGSDQGYVSLIDIEGPTLLYQKRIASELCTGIISLQFETCNLHGFEKNVLVVATKDSSILALDGDAGNILSASVVQPKKPSRALFMQILDGQDTLSKGSNITEDLDLSKGNVVEGAMSKQLLLLICSEKAAYVYSLMHAVQGVKKVHSKKKFHSSCCWASTFCSPSDVGLILLFTSGKIEIRSLPDLSLLKETSLMGFTYSTSKLNSIFDSSICSSMDGELIMVNGDQEIIFLSVLQQKEGYRLLDSASQIYHRDLMVSQEGILPGRPIQAEKKKGIFSSVIKNLKGSEAKPVPDIEVEDTKESIEELSMIFSVANFPVDTENGDDQVMDEDEVQLNIDDIDLEDPVQKPKGQNNMMAALNTQKLASKFQAFKGKLKHMKGKNDKTSAKEEQHDEKPDTVDEIKKRYGFPASSISSAKMAENKLKDNLVKLQGISMRTTEMNNTAKSFSFMAKEVLRTAEHDKQNT